MKTFAYMGCLMLWFNGLAGLLVLGCLYHGLNTRAQQIARTMSLWGLGIVAMFVIALTLWCTLFYSLANIPLTLVRPWGVWDFILQSEQMNTLTNLELWCFPVVVIGFMATHFIAPLLVPSWRHLYGNAHWATKGEVKKMGFYESGNVLVGDYNGTLLRYQLTNHLLIFAPSRSGKGVSIVIPNALNWQGSLLVTDNKYEVFDYTSGHRKQSGNEVYRFSPANKEFQTHRINPLDYIDRINPSKRIADIHLILDVLITSSNDENKMWAEEARSIALGLLQWLMQSGRPFTLGELASIIKGGVSLDEFLTRVIEEHTIADNLITLDHAAYLAIQSFLQKAPKEQSGVRSTLTSMLRLWEDPLINAATSASDVDFRDMRKRPITLYLSFGTGQISRLAPLINLIVQLFLNVMLNNLPSQDEPCKVLCLLDEINRFGRMDKLKDGFGDLAGYGVHLMPIIQNVGQFYSTYGGRDNSDIFFQNTDLKIGFRQNADTDKQFLSRELGNKTVRIKNRSYGTNREGSNYSESLIERPLLSTAEVGRFSKKKQMIITGDGVIQCKKIIYYKDKRFKHKLLKPIEVPTVVPQFPIIEVKKTRPAEEVPPAQSGAQASARMIGQAIAETLAPLVNRHEQENKPPHPPVVDNETKTLLSHLANAFEEEGA